MLRITSKKDGFRRCGVSHPATPTEYPDDRFTEAQIQALHAEAMLVVEEFYLMGDDEKEGQVVEVGARPNANDTIALVKAAGTIETLDKLGDGEDRKSVLAAIDARRKELGE